MEILPKPQPVMDMNVVTVDGVNEALKNYKWRVCLIVNLARKSKYVE